jgi:hypothetical protein
MKICILCYVLPKGWDCGLPSVGDNSTVSTNSSSSNGGTSTSSSSINDHPAQSPYLSLFNHHSTSSMNINNITQTVSISPSLSTLDTWEVRPLTFLVRRQQVNNERYPTVQDVYKRYQKSSKLRFSRRSKAAAMLPGPANTLSTAITAANKRRKRSLKKRRDVKEVRLKSQSRSNAIWNLLLNEENAGKPVQGDANVSKDTGVIEAEEMEVQIEDEMLMNDDSVGDESDEEDFKNDI